MNTRIEVDTKEVDRLFDRLDRQFSKDIVKALDVTSQFAISFLLDRTAKGEGYQGRFLPYTPEYSAFRKKNGRQNRFVDLNYSGKMTSSIIRKVNKPALTAELMFSRAAEAKKAVGISRKRPWFGFNDREQRILKRYFYGRLTK